MPNVIKVDDQKVLVQTAKFPHAKWGFEEFNPVQSRLFEIYEGDSNVAIAASTSAGKTVCAEMYMSYEIRKRGGKAIYIGPLRALAKEKEDEWCNPDYHFGDLKVSICTGDFRITANRVKELDSANILVMTPEMLASRCRNHKSEKSNFLKGVGTIVFDESHLLTVPGRGDHIEVALMKLSEINPDCRVVLLSATMPNVDEICGWVSGLTGRNTHYLESKYRPVPLGINYPTYFDGVKTYDEKENEKVATAVGIVNHFSDDKFLIFVHTKRTGQLMLDYLKKYGIKAEFHNANLELKKRLEIEGRFRDKKSDLRVVIATSTLAWGCYKHGMMIAGRHGVPVRVESVREGEEILCPVGDKFENRVVVRTNDFESEKGYYVKLEGGQEAVVSEDHVFYAAAKREKPNWCPVIDLERGDYIAVPSGYGRWDEHSPFSKYWYLCGFIFGDGCLARAGKHSDQSPKVMLDICLGQRDIFAQKVVDLFNGLYNTQCRMRDDKNGVPHLVCKRRNVVSEFQRYLQTGRKKGSHDIPIALFSDRGQAANFLSGWFDADGGVEDHGNGNSSIGLSCISKRAIRSAQTLLLHFDIYSVVGRKKMKDSVINGRLQKAKRKWSYRLRVFGQKDMERFARLIGFAHPEKWEALHTYLEEIPDKPTKDLIPARSLLKDHLDANGMSSNDFRRITGSNIWNSIHRQDCRRTTLEKLLREAKETSGLTELLEAPYRWVRIKEIRFGQSGKFREIEVEDPSAYVGGGMISHNCNLPARRVIVTGIDRGLTSVENYDINQMIGRAGRKGLDPRGDAYILVPESKKKEAIERLKHNPTIKSQLLEEVGGYYKTLAFHVVSEIHHGEVTTKEGFHAWFKRTLAYHQTKTLHTHIIDKTIDQLVKCRAITVENNKYAVTSVGTVASMFYYSPFDVAHLKENFTKLFDRGRHRDDIHVATALANIDSHRFGIVNKVEKLEMSRFATKIKEYYGEDGVPDSAVKIAFAYHNLLTGKDVPAFQALQQTLRQDADRTLEVLNAIDTMASKWGKSDWLRTLRARIAYGVKEELVGLVGIPNVGKVRAEKLYKANIRNLDEFIAAGENMAAVVMGVPKATAVKIMEAARHIKLQEML